MKEERSEKEGHKVACQRKNFSVRNARMTFPDPSLDLYVNETRYIPNENVEQADIDDIPLNKSDEK